MVHEGCIGRLLLFTCSVCRVNIVVDIKEEIEKYFKSKPVVKAFFRKDKDKS